MSNATATLVPGGRIGGGLPSPIGWEGFGQWADAGAAFCCALVAIWIVQRRGRSPQGLTRRPEIVALAISAAWAMAAAGLGAGALPAGIGETMRNLAWLWVAWTLFARDGRHASLGPVRPMLVVLAGLELLQPALLILASRCADIPDAPASILQMVVTLRLLLVIGALVLVHNLYVGAIGPARGRIRWTCAALALLWGYELNYYTIAWLAGGFPIQLTALRGVALVAFANLLAVGEVRRGSAQRLSPSRAVAFQSLSLLVIGIYLIVMVGASRSLALLGGGTAHLVQLAFALGSTTLALVFVPSARLRGWLKVTVAKHFFQHRYDYRAEWLRFTETIGRAGASEPSLPERVVKALADITDSQFGILAVPDETGQLEIAARWQWRTLEVPAPMLPLATSAFLERTGFIVDLDAVRRGAEQALTEQGGERLVLPDWLIAEDRAWALVPLLHFGRLAGVVVLGRPPYARTLDWEDFDLLRVIGRQLASYLAEQASQQALLEASRFEDFNRRMAFVMHDIKNLASQLGLLAHNAERHADNPAFRADMLVTLRSASDRLNAMIARLSRYGATSAGSEAMESVDARPLLERIAAGYPGAAIVIDIVEPCVAIAGAEPLEQVVRHLVQNALDASEPGHPVILRARPSGLELLVEVIDNGCGMSAEFVRSSLFKPFVSSKPGGFGIGVFESRALVQAMRGRLEVESREGLGTRFIIRLPLAVAQGPAMRLAGSAGAVATRFTEIPCDTKVA